MTRPRAARAAIVLIGIALVIALLALGTWQVQRRAWKLALIDRVEAGLRAAPAAAPAAAGPSDAYRRVVVSGSFLRGRETFVQASTVHGPGWWVLTPLRAVDGRTVLINRGYVPKRSATLPEPGLITVTGLLRLSEPRGGFLRTNDPAADRWYSRDVAAIAARRGLGRVIPYFIDADASGNRAGQPIGGLTLVKFTNNHLVYAVTWYALAMMTTVALVYWSRHDRDTA